MKKISPFPIILLLLFLGFSNQSFGQVVNNFTLSDTDGKPFSLASLKEKAAVVVVFSGNHCVYSKKYEPRIKDLTATLASKNVAVVMINSNDPKLSEEETLEAMKVRAKENGYTFPYLQDANQAVARQFGATKNPEAFLLKPGNDGFKIVFSGSIDDNALMADRVEKKYLANAIEALLSGGSPSPGVPAVGCNIKGL